MARESAWERLRGAVAALADSLFGWVPEPLWVPLALALLVVPAGLLIWGGGPEPGGPSSQLAAQAPEPLPAPTRVVGPVEGVEEEVVAPVLPEARPSQGRPTAAPSVIAQAPPPPDAPPGREVPAVAPPSRIAAASRDRRVALGRALPPARPIASSWRGWRRVTIAALTFLSGINSQPLDQKRFTDHVVVPFMYNFEEPFILLRYLD